MEHIHRPFRNYVVSLGLASCCYNSAHCIAFLSVMLEFQDSARSWLQWRKGRMYRVVIV